MSWDKLINPRGVKFSIQNLCCPLFFISNINSSSISILPIAILTYNREQSCHISSSSLVVSNATTECNAENI